MNRDRNPPDRVRGQSPDHVRGKCVRSPDLVMRASRFILLGLIVAALAASGCMRRPAPRPIAEPMMVEPAPLPPPVIAAPVVAVPAITAAPVIVEEPIP